MRHFWHARPAPGREEVNEHDFTVKCFAVEFLSIQGHPADFGDLLADFGQRAFKFALFGRGEI
jgi:hypothetical protein